MTGRSGYRGRGQKRKVNSAPGKNYGLIKNQWERWQLSSFEEAQPDLKLPPAYDAPAVQPKHKCSRDADTDSLAADSAKGAAGAPRRKGWQRKDAAAAADGGGGGVGGGVGGGKAVAGGGTGTVSSFAALFQPPDAEGEGSPGEKLPPLPLPTLVELTEEEKLHLAMSRVRAHRQPPAGRGPRQICVSAASRQALRS